MAKLSSYKGSVSLIAGLKPASSGYALMEANDVQVAEDGTRLDAKLSSIDASLGTSSDTANASGTSVWSRVKQLQNDVGSGSDGDSLSARMTTAEGDIDTLQDNLGTRGAGSDPAFTRIGTLESGVSDINTQIGTDASGSTAGTGIKGRISALENEVGGAGNENSLNTRVTALETAVGDGTGASSLSARVTSAESAITQLNTDMDAIPGTISDLQDEVDGSLTNIENVLVGDTTGSNVVSGYTNTKNLNTRMNEAETAINALQGNMLVVSLAADMTNHNTHYIYTGSETGYTNNHWYYWDSTANSNAGAWADGGAVAGVTIDDQLETQGAAADAKAVGDAISELSSDMDDLNNKIVNKAPINIIDINGNMLFLADKVEGYYYANNIKYKSDNYCYFIFDAEADIEYTEVEARFVYAKDGGMIINDEAPGNSVRKFTLSTPTTLYVSFSHECVANAFCGKSSDYSSDASRYGKPNLNINALAQVDGDSDKKAASQKLVHDIKENIEAAMSNNTAKDGSLYPLSIKGIEYNKYSTIILPEWNNGYAFNGIGNKINITNSNGLCYICISVSESIIYFNMTVRFACICDANDIVIDAYNSNNTSIREISIPSNGEKLYITIGKEYISSFICSTINGLSYPSLRANFELDLPNYDNTLSQLLSSKRNMLTSYNRKEKICKVGSEWLQDKPGSNSSYANFDTYWFIAEAGIQYTFGCATRFFTVNDTVLYNNGTLAGFTYTPENDCTIWVCIARYTKEQIKCVAASTTLDEVNDVGIATLNHNLIAQETGNSSTLLMSQKAITEAIGSTANIQNKIYGKGFVTINGDLNDGESFYAPITNVKKNNVFSFVCNITTFSSVLIGHGKTMYNSTYIEITSTEIIRHNYTSSDSVKQWEHGITIADYLNVEIKVKNNGKAKIQIFSNGESFNIDDIGWAGDSNSRPFVESVGSTLTNCEFTWSSKDFRKSVWMFGDSYFGFTDDVRWPYYLAQNEYLDNVLLNAYPGENTTAALLALNAMLDNYGCPNFIVWCLGMNDGTDSNDTPSSSWMSGVNQVIQLCSNKGITPIFATIPSVPGRTGVSPICHEAKNAWIRGSGYRYIDFAKAVGATWNNEDTTWHTGMISSDGIHPDKLGALALYYRAITDVPEITFTNP